MTKRNQKGEKLEISFAQKNKWNKENRRREKRKKWKRTKKRQRRKKRVSRSMSMSSILRMTKQQVGIYSKTYTDRCR